MSEVDRSNRWFRLAVALGQQDDYIEVLKTERRELLVKVIRSLGCTCSPGIGGTETDWWTDPNCPLHGS